MATSTPLPSPARRPKGQDNLDDEDAALKANQEAANILLELHQRQERQRRQQMEEEEERDRALLNHLASRALVGAAKPKQEPAEVITLEDSADAPEDKADPDRDGGHGVRLKPLHSLVGEEATTEEGELVETKEFASSASSNEKKRRNKETEAKRPKRSAPKPPSFPLPNLRERESKRRVYKGLTLRPNAERWRTRSSRDRNRSEERDVRGSKRTRTSSDPRPAKRTAASTPRRPKANNSAGNERANNESNAGQNEASPKEAPSRAIPALRARPLTRKFTSVIAKQQLAPAQPPRGPKQVNHHRPPMPPDLAQHDEVGNILRMQQGNGIPPLMSHQFVMGTPPRPLFSLPSPVVSPFGLSRSIQEGRAKIKAREAKVAELEAARAVNGRIAALEARVEELRAQLYARMEEVKMVKAEDGYRDPEAVERLEADVKEAMEWEGIFREEGINV